MPGTNEDIKRLLLAAKSGNLEEVQTSLSTGKVSINDILQEEIDDIPAGTPVAQAAFSCTLQSTCDLNEQSIAALDAIANLILDTVQDKQKQKKVILMGEANVYETPALVYAAEKGMLNTTVRLINEFKVPYNVVLDPLHIVPRPDLNILFQFPDGASALEAAIAHDHLALVKMFLVGHIWLTAPSQPGRTLIQQYRVDLGEPMDITPRHLELAFNCGTSFAMMEILYAKLNYADRRQFFEIYKDRTILKAILKRKHKIQDINGETVYIHRECDSDTAKAIIDRNWIKQRKLTKLDAAGRTIIFDAVHGTGKFVESLLTLLADLRPDESFATKADQHENTPIAYAANVAGLQAIPVLVKYGASVADIHAADFLDDNYVFTYFDHNTKQEIVASGSILQFAALCKHYELLIALLALSEDKFPVAAREKQLMSVIDPNYGKTVIEYLRANDINYAAELEVITAAGLRLEIAVVKDPIQEAHIEEALSEELSAIFDADLSKEDTEPPAEEDTRRFEDTGKRRASMFSAFGSCFGAPSPVSTTSTPTTRSAATTRSAPATRTSSPMTTEPPMSNIPGRLLPLFRIRATTPSTLATPSTPATPFSAGSLSSPDSNVSSPASIAPVVGAAKTSAALVLS